MPFVRPAEMLAGTPLPGWSGRFVHSPTMTFAHDDIAAGAAPLHEHQHEHEQEEVWHIVDGVVVPPHTPHSVRPLSACRAIIADYPLRPDLPGVSPPR